VSSYLRDHIEVIVIFMTTGKVKVTSRDSLLVHVKSNAMYKMPVSSSSGTFVPTMMAPKVEELVREL
jgi:hypothetical protein